MRPVECIHPLLSHVALYCMKEVAHLLLLAGTAHTLVDDSEDNFLGRAVVFELDTVGISVQR